MIKRTEHEQALSLRREGITYQAIQQRLGVAKSTVWRWLKAEGLVDGYSPKYLDDRMRNQRKAAEAVHRARLERTEATMSRARNEIDSLSSRDLRLIGAALYWAEGAKQRESRPSCQVIFSNTDPRMLRVFVEFLIRCCDVEYGDLYFQIQLHETANADTARAYWCNELGIESIRTAPVTWKRHNPKTVRKNVGERYHGLLRILVRGSVDLNRRLAGWAAAIHESLGSGVMETHRALDPKTPGSNPGSPATFNDDDLVLCDGDGASLTDYWTGNNGASRRR